MIYAKTLSVAVAALMAFAGIASATQLTSPAGTTYTGSVNAATEGTGTFDSPFGAINCHGILSHNIEQHGTGLAVKGNVSELSFDCTGSFNVIALKKGTIEIHPIAGAGNGTLTWSGAEIEVFYPMVNIKCIYTHNSTHFGTLTGSNVTGGTAKLDIAASMKRVGGSGLCGTAGGYWTATYKVNTPDSLLVDP